MFSKQGFKIFAPSSHKTFRESFIKCILNTKLEKVTSAPRPGALLSLGCEHCIVSTNK